MFSRNMSEKSRIIFFIWELCKKYIGYYIWCFKICGFWNTRFTCNRSSADKLEQIQCVKPLMILFHSDCATSSPFCLKILPTGLCFYTTVACNAPVGHIKAPTKCTVLFLCIWNKLGALINIDIYTSEL